MKSQFQNHRSPEESDISNVLTVVCASLAVTRLGYTFGSGEYTLGSQSA